MAENLNVASPPNAPVGAGDAIMLLTAFLFGSSFPVAKSILPIVDPALFAAARYGLAGLVLFGWMGLRQRRLRVAGADIGLLLLCAAVFAFFQLIWAYLLSRTNASVGAIFMATSPLWGTLLATLGGERLKPLGWLGIALAFLGVALVINNSLHAVTVDFDSLAVSLLWLLIAFLWAFFVAKSPPLVAQLGATRMFAWVIVAASLMMAPVALWSGGDTAWGQVTPLVWAKFLYTALFSAALALALWNIGLVRLGITRTMIYMYMVPLFAIGIAVLFLGEHMTLARWIGAASVLAGIALTRKAAS
ncbi:MAG: DMT family transporter [Reyranellaceae bacterium]